MMLNPTTLKRRLAAAACMGFLAMLLYGATRVVSDHRHQDQAAALANQRMTAWHRQLVTELPVDERDEWRALAMSNPDLLLRSCSLEVRQR